MSPADPAGFWPPVASPAARRTQTRSSCGIGPAWRERGRRRPAQVCRGYRPGRPATDVPGWGGPAAQSGRNAGSRGGRPDCRYPRSRCRRDAALAKTGCRTSCRNGRDSWAIAPWSPGYGTCGPPTGRPECIQSRKPTGSPAAPARCWWARCDGRARQRDTPGNYPAAASGHPGRQRPRRTPRSCVRFGPGNGFVRRSAGPRGGQGAG